MNQSIQLKMKKLPKALGELTHSNQFLKMSAFSSYLLCGLLITLLFYQAIKPTAVITLAPDASVYQNIDAPKPENEIRQAVKEYLERRYQWEPKTVVKQLQAAQIFILPSTRKTFESSMANVARFSTEKLVSQRVYPEKILVNLEKRVVSILGDRITSIQGLKAAGDLKLELQFDFGPRTLTNPWGVYISKEREEN